MGAGITVAGSPRAPQKQGWIARHLGHIIILIVVLVVVLPIAFVIPVRITITFTCDEQPAYAYNVQVFIDRRLLAHLEIDEVQSHASFAVNWGHHEVVVARNLQVEFYDNVWTWPIVGTNVVCEVV